MKLSLKGDTAARLAQTEDDLAAAEATLADLRRDREAMLADGEASDIEKLDQQIGNYERQAAVFRERIPLLQSRLAEERATERARQRAAAIKTAEEILPQRALPPCALLPDIKALSNWLGRGAPTCVPMRKGIRLQSDPKIIRALRLRPAALFPLLVAWNWRHQREAQCGY